MKQMRKQHIVWVILKKRYPSKPVFDSAVISNAICRISLQRKKTLDGINAGLLLKPTSVLLT